MLATVYKQNYKENVAISQKEPPLKVITSSVKKNNRIFKMQKAYKRQNS